METGPEAVVSHRHRRVSLQYLISGANLRETQSEEEVGPLLSIPIREEFRLQRLWFFYHDLRAFTTSWIPLPVFVIYRILVFLYAAIWLALHIVARSDGPHWLIFATNLSYTLLVISTGSMAILCCVYLIINCKNSEMLLKYIPRRDFPVRRIYKQDNIPWYVKLIWGLYIVSKTTAVLIFLGYWLIVYTPCEGEDREGGSGPDNDTRQSRTDEEGFSGEGSARFCSFLDVYTVQVHGINVVIVLADMFLSRVPYQFLHFLYPSIFTLAYVVFSLVYWGAKGTNTNGMPYIYSALDYGSNTFAFGLAVVLIVSPIIIFFILFLLAWLRDVACKRIECCFRDVKQLPYQDSNRLPNLEMNGDLAATESDHVDEITKV